MRSITFESNAEGGLCVGVLRGEVDTQGAPFADHSFEGHTAALLGGVEHG